MFIFNLLLYAFSDHIAGLLAVLLHDDHLRCEKYPFSLF